MATLRGFGITFDTASGACRNWYAGADGIQRWVDNDQPVSPPAALETPQPARENG